MNKVFSIVKQVFDGLNVMNNLMSDKKSQYISRWKEKVELWKEFKPTSINVSNTSYKHSGIKRIPLPPIPPHTGRQIRLGLEDINLEDVWKFIK